MIKKVRFIHCTLFGPSMGLLFLAFYGRSRTPTFYLISNSDRITACICGNSVVMLIKYSLFQKAYIQWSQSLLASVDAEGEPHLSVECQSLQHRAEAQLERKVGLEISYTCWKTLQSSECRATFPEAPVARRALVRPSTSVKSRALFKYR